jgi:hypothetical protein
MAKKEVEVDAEDLPGPNAELVEKYEGWTAKDLAIVMHKLGTKIDKLEAELKPLNKEWDFLRQFAVPTACEDEGIDGMTIKNVGRLSLTGDLWANILKPKREDAYQWLRDNGHEGLITETVNAGSLKAAIKEVLKKNARETDPEKVEQWPDNLFSITPFTRASITKG